MASIKINSQELGLAGEFRVMSELIFRGWNPAKSYIDNGIDVILQNGVRVQIKTSRKKASVRSDNRGSAECYRFTLKRGDYNNRKTLSSKNVDFLICWGIETNNFWIIPTDKVDGLSQIAIPLSSKGKYRRYLNNWKLLGRR